MMISTFNDDLIGLKEFACRLEKFIETEVDYVDGGLVIALTSKYGSGKTTFLEMWKSSLDIANEEFGKPLVISLNAWESDYYGDPLFAIISALIEGLKSKNKDVGSLVVAAKNFGLFATVIGGQLVNKFTGIDVIAAGDLAEKKKGERQEASQTIPDSFSLYLDRKNAMKSLKEEIEKIVAESDQRVLFLVDELDRCRPDCAITYLETIKHIFDIKGAVFLLAADRHQIENSARSAFGPNLDFEEYYRKFIHREITLPKITETGYGNLASKYVSLFLDRDGERYCFMELGKHRELIVDLIDKLKLTPRQIQEVFRILGHVLSTTKENKGKLLWTLEVGSIVMAAFKVGNPKFFDLLGSQNLHSDKAIEYLKQLQFVDPGMFNFWFLFFLSGGGIHMDEGETEEDILRREGFEKGKGDLEKDFDWGFGRSGSGRFAEIHEKIQQILQWK